MTAIAIFVCAALGIMIFPMLIPYLLLSYMVVNGVASRDFINNGLKVSAGGVNIFPPDLLYAAALLLAIFGMIRLFLTRRLRKFASLTKAVIAIVTCYFVFFAIKFVNGYFAGVPIDSLVRLFASDTQCVYFLLVLLNIKNEKMLVQLLYFVVIVSVVFPFFQPFLYGSVDQIALEKGQGGTLRLGSGIANLFLMLGIFALFVWERKLWLSVIPLAGIAMLGQRSAFLSLALGVMVLAIRKKNTMKYLALSGTVGVLLVVALIVIQAATSVPVVDKAVERLSQTFERTGSTEARINVIPVALTQIGEQPIVGFSYRDIYALTLQQDSDAFAFNMLHPHNFVLASLLRSGFIGSFLLFSVIGIALLSAFRLSRQKATQEQGLYLASTIMFYVLFGTMNTSFFSAGEVFWVLVGVSMWYINKAYYSERQHMRRIS